MRNFNPISSAKLNWKLGSLLLITLLTSFYLKSAYIGDEIAGSFSSVLVRSGFLFPLEKILYFCSGIAFSSAYNMQYFYNLFPAIKVRGILQTNSITNIALALILILLLGVSLALNIEGYGIVAIKGALTISLLSIKKQSLLFALCFVATLVTFSKFFLLLPVISLLQGVASGKSRKYVLILFYASIGVFVYSIFAPNAIAYKEISLVQIVLRRIEVLEIWSLFEIQGKALCHGSAADWLWAPGAVFSGELRNETGINFGGSIGPSLPGQLYCLGVPSFFSWFLPGALLPILIKALVHSKSPYPKAFALMLTLSVFGGLNFYHLTYFCLSMFLYMLLQGTTTSHARN